MTVARFETITRHLHLKDNSKMPARGTPGFDKLFKVRPFLDSIRANFLTQYVPHKEVAIDEAMIKFKGRSSLKQYMPMKPIKRGIKMWCRADGINGYLNHFKIYTGKSGEGSPNHEQRTLKEFRVDLAKKLIGDFTSRKRPGRPSMELIARLTERHFPSHLPTNEKGKVKERRCHVCSTKDKPKKTSYWCVDCGCWTVCSSMFLHSPHTPINN
ncbi:Hypothetical predicted protein [Paramuricea clavata]|uniref:Uncharacterized protein n=1 Tax=Paramuricea clavata TaxID=317549 RepID=A0A7D9J547_PARCT|nr:Hypothetical predicted protein [Paramuricea clavata]